MEIQNYCLDCQHRFIPTSLKKKFNRYSGEIFISCPEKSEKIVGCLIKSNVKIDWGGFAKFLDKNNDLTKTEKKSLIMLGLYRNEEVDEEENER